jgi:PI-3-kinase-related kinase SMG-1
MGAWWAVQEAAKHLVLSRLRTHFGNPSQTFAGLERALQHSLGTRADSALEHQSAWLLLEFMDAIERSVHNAFEGSLQRHKLPQGVMAFFSANRKVPSSLLSHHRATLSHTE